MEETRKLTRKSQRHARDRIRRRDDIPTLFSSTA